MLGLLAGMSLGLGLMSNPRRRRRRAKRRNPSDGPTAKEARLLEILRQEAALARNRYENRTHRDDARALRKRAVQAELRFRSFWRAAEARMRRANPGGWVATYKEGRRGPQPWRVDRDLTSAAIEQAHRDGWQIVFGDTREAALRALTREAKLRGVELAQRTNPAMPEGYDARGTRYKLKRKAETREWVLVAYVNGKRHEGRTLYFDDRKDAEDTLAHITGQRSNPATYWWYREVRYDRDGEPTKSWRRTNDAVMATSEPAPATTSVRWKRGGAVDPSVVARDVERAGAARALRSNPRAKKLPPQRWYEIDKSKPPRAMSVVYPFTWPASALGPLIGPPSHSEPGKPWPAGRLAIPDGMWAEGLRSDGHRLTPLPTVIITTLPTAFSTASFSKPNPRRRRRRRK